MRLKTSFFSIFLMNLSVTLFAAPTWAGSPQAAIQAALSEPLQLLDHGMFDNDDIPACLFSNSNALVLYGYCGKKSAGAVDVRIFLSDGSETTFYVESNGEHPVDPVTLPPGRYPSGWAWQMTWSSSSAVFSLAEINKLSDLKSLVDSYKLLCSTGEFDNSVNCENDPQWADDALQLKESPSSDWVQLLQELEKRRSAANSH